MKLVTSFLLAAGGCFAIPAASGASLVGLWEFSNAGNIGQATVGSPLTIAGTAPTHSATLGSESGVITTVVGPANNLVMGNPIGANGGGALTNDYSLLFDVQSPVGSQASWRCFFQTDPTNANDGDFFIRNNNQQLGVGATGYSGDNFPETQWTRLVLTVTGGSIVAYTDGNPFFTYPTNLGIDSRLAFGPTVLMFGDEDGENAALDIGTLAFWDGVLTPGEIAALGGAGRPVPEPGAAVLALAAAGFGIRRRRRA
jgi:hypothetical protein